MIDGFTMRNKNEEIQKERNRKDLQSKAPTGSKQGISVNG